MQKLSKTVCLFLLLSCSCKAQSIYGIWMDSKESYAKVYDFGGHLILQCIPPVMTGRIVIYFESKENASTFFKRLKRSARKAKIS